jgi:hypothetical protein
MCGGRCRETPVRQAIVKDALRFGGRRRVRENVRFEEQRWGPLRGERRKVGKLNGPKLSADQWRLNRVLAISRGDRRNRAIVLGAIRVRVDTLMQLRRNAEHSCPDKRGDNANHHERARVVF